MERVSFGRRLVALLIDWLVAMLSVAAVTGTALAGPGAASSFWTLGAFLLEVGLTTGLLGYSIGKRVLGLRVEGPDGRPIGLVRGLARTAAVCLVIPPVVTNAEGRGLHDVLTGSRVARLG
ncbi:MAG: RDD family protein [Aeromicrobium erythreum]